MAKLFFRLGRFVVVSRKQKQVRSTLVFLFKNFFLGIGILLTLEIVVIALSLNGVVFPLPSGVLEFLSRIAL